MKKVKIIKLIEVTCLKGDGTEKSPKRFIKQYWTLNGKKIFEKDDYLDDTISRASSKAKSYEIK